MRDIRYDAEGDILYITFEDARGQPSTGIELMDNVVLYFNPETERPLKMILLSYARLVAASARQPLLLDGLAELPMDLRRVVLRVLNSSPVNLFLRMAEVDSPIPRSSLTQVFMPEVMKAVA